MLKLRIGRNMRCYFAVSFIYFILSNRVKHKYYKSASLLLQITNFMIAKYKRTKTKQKD